MKAGTVRKIFAMVLAAGGLAAGPGGPATQPANQPATRPAADVAPARRPWSQYEVVIQHNVFLRQAERGSRRDGGDYRRGGGPAAGWVLTGTALRGSDRLAFFENTQTGSTIRVQAGHTAAPGHVVQVDADSVEIESNGGTRRVAVGSLSDGSPAPTTMPATTNTATAGPGTTTGAAATAPSDETGGASGDSVLERMRARRNRELSN